MDTAKRLLVGIVLGLISGVGVGSIVAAIVQSFLPTAPPYVAFLALGGLAGAAGGLMVAATHHSLLGSLASRIESKFVFPSYVFSLGVIVLLAILGAPAMESLKLPFGNPTPVTIQGPWLTAALFGAVLVFLSFVLLLWYWVEGNRRRDFPVTMTLKEVDLAAFRGLKAYADTLVASGLSDSQFATASGLSLSCVQQIRQARVIGIV